MRTHKVGSVFEGAPGSMFTDHSDHIGMNILDARNESSCDTYMERAVAEVSRNGSAILSFS